MPTGYGRVVRGADGGAHGDRRGGRRRRGDHASIGEINVGTYAFDAAWLRAALDRVAPSASGEQYLTDLVALAVADGRRSCVVEADDAADTIGINDRVALGRGRGAHAPPHRRRRTCATG